MTVTKAVTTTVLVAVGALVTLARVTRRLLQPIDLSPP
jgi:hypothetical protein